MDAALRIDLRDVAIEMLHCSLNTHTSSSAKRSPLQQIYDQNDHKICSPLHTIHKRKQSRRVINDLDNVDFILKRHFFSRQEALLYVFEDNEAVIKMIIKGRSSAMRHVSRTHRVALDWLFDRINLDPKIQIKYIDTKNQLADRLTKGNFTRD